MTAAAMRQSIVSLLRTAAAMLDSLATLTSDGGPAQAASAVRQIAASFADPVSPDWRFEYHDERT